MKSLLKYAAFALVAGILLFGFDAAADDFWTKVFSNVGTVFRNVRIVVYIIGAFGLIGVAVGFIFGKLQLKWLAFLAIGLAIVAAADLVVNYAIGGRDRSSVGTIESPDTYIGTTAR